MSQNKSLLSEATSFCYVITGMREGVDLRALPTGLPEWCAFTHPPPAACAHPLRAAQHHRDVVLPLFLPPEHLMAHHVPTCNAEHSFKFYWPFRFLL